MIASARRPSRPWMWPWLVLPIGVGELVGAPRGGATSFPFHERTRRCSRYGWSQAQPGATRRVLRSATPTLVSATFCDSHPGERCVLRQNRASVQGVVATPVVDGGVVGGCS